MKALAPPGPPTATDVGAPGSARGTDSGTQPMSPGAHAAGIGGTADDDTPRALTESTRTSTGTPGASPVSVSCVTVGGVVGQSPTDPVPHTSDALADGAHVMRYPVSAEPASDAGGCHVTSSSLAGTAASSSVSVLRK